MSEEELKYFVEWLVGRQKLHEDMGDENTRSDAYRLNHSSRALAFLEVRAELKSRLATAMQITLERKKAQP